MILENPDNYTFIEFKKSTTKNKKYDAILMNKKTNKLKKISFGDKRYPHYNDKTGLNLYPKLNSLDKQKRKMYLLRHAGEDKNMFSSGYFAIKFLW